jgi:hypothetical protein
LVYSIHDPTEVAIQKITEAIKKAMLDKAGKTDKGYFTPSDLTFHLMISPMTTWEYNKIRLAIDRLVKESKIVELESGQRYSPLEKSQENNNNDNDNKTDRLAESIQK